MSDYVDPFEEFKKKKLAEKSAQQEKAPAQPPAQKEESAEAAAMRAAAEKIRAHQAAQQGQQSGQPAAQQAAPPETQQPQQAAQAAPAPVNAAAPAEAVAPKAFEIDSGRFEKKSAEEIEAELVRPEFECSLEFGQGGSDVAQLGADQVGGELKAAIDRDNRMEGGFPDSDIRVSDEKPDGIESHRHESVELEDLPDKPEGFDSGRAEKKETDEEGESGEKPAGLTKY